LLTYDAAGYKPLLGIATVRAVPSLRILSEAGPDSSASDKGLFALGDPAYPDPESTLGINESDLRAVSRDLNYQAYFTPLPETRTEVQAIARLFTNEPVNLSLGNKATEATVKQAGLEQYRFLHFATHGILGGEVPGIGEPALVLGQDENEDGFLKASEAEQLPINAALTVLSACNTGSGEIFSGEGVMGMSRAFLVAGSRSVLVSLWPVASKPTEDMMVRFYRHLRSGKAPAQALRSTKMEMREMLPHPFFWSAFVIIEQR
jgi:CHAT domain-containing protein